MNKAQFMIRKLKKRKLSEQPTFKDYLGEAKYYRQQEDWQDDMNEYGVQVGVCPKCKGEAQLTSTGNNLASAKTFWECTECGHKGKPTGY